MVVVHNFDIKGFPIMPRKTDAPLVVDANAVLAGALALQSLEAVSPNGVEVVKIGCSMKPTETFPRGPFDALELPSA